MSFVDTKLSIITVTYNSERYLRETLNSVLRQKYNNYEYIIVDGGSTDSTLEILAEYTLLFGGKMSYVSEPDKGIYDAMNKGIMRTTGDYIGIINSDDRYTPDCFRHVVKTLSESTELPDVIYSDMNRIDENGNFCGVIAGNAELLKRGMLVNHPTCFVSKKAYEKYGLFDLKYRIAADYDLMLRIRNGGGSFRKCKEILSEYRDGGISFNNYKSVLEKYAIQRKYYSLPFCWYIRMRGFYRCKICGEYKDIMIRSIKLVYNIPNVLVTILNKITFIIYGVQFGADFTSKGVICIATNRHPKINSGKNIRIGKSVSINSSFKSNMASHSNKTVLYIIENGSIKIGNHVGISNSILAARKAITIEDYVMIGSGCKIYDNDWHPVDFVKRIRGGTIISAPVRIKTGAWLCEGVTVLKGVTIGERAVIAAGSVVTKDVPADEVWAGNPARCVKKLK